MTLTVGNYIAQAASLDGAICASPKGRRQGRTQQRFAIAKIREQYPNETEELEPVTAGGILAPDQAIALDKATPNRCY